MNFGAAVSLALALALWAGAANGPALAQERLPSVSDYRLPSPAAAPRPRAQGPVDGDAPTVIAPPAAQSAPDSPPPAETASKPAPKPSQSARAPDPQPSASQAEQASASPRPAAQPARPASPNPAESAAVAAPVPPGTPASDASAAPIDWHVHSAAEAANGSGVSWLWPTVAAFLLGAAAMLLAQQMLRRKRAAAASASEVDWEVPAEHAEAPATSAPATTPDQAPAEMPPVQPMPQPPQPSAQPTLDLLAIMAEPEHAEPVPAQTQPSAFPAALAEPLALELSARRLSATLMNTVLNYELTVSNTGPEAIRSIIIGGDMIGAHASLPNRAQLELSGNNLTALHTIAALAPGESVVLKGEFKLPLTAITPIRNGNAALFIPLTRFRLEAIGRSALPFAISRTFVVGEDQDRPGAALKPFRLDLGPRLYSQIGQRELALTA